MNAKTHNVIQGTEAWHELRLSHFGASDAPTVMGCGYKTREQLLQEKSTGIREDVDASTQRRFDLGHEYEAAIRPHVEAILGEELFTPTMTKGKLLASLDGITMMGDVTFEHKMLNKSLAIIIPLVALGETELEPKHYWQLEQQLYVSGAEKVFFAASNGTPETMVYCYYEAVPGRIEQLLAAWDQFEIDLANYVPTEKVAEVVATPVIDLPALIFDVEGEVKGSNLAIYKQSAEDLISSVNTKLVTDQHFADAELMVKKFKDAEDALESAKSRALAKTASIDELFREVDHWKELFRQKRLELEKLVKAEKDNRKTQISQAGKKALEDFYQQSVSSCGVSFERPAADFAGAIKNKRNLSSMEESVAQVVADAKVAITLTAEKITNNRAVFLEITADKGFLFPDANQLFLKDQADLVAVVKSRISDHEAAEKLKTEQKAAQELAAKPQIIERQPDAAQNDSAPAQTVKPRIRAGFNEHGLNTGYVAQRLQLIMRDLNTYSPKGLMDALKSLADSLSETEAA